MSAILKFFLWNPFFRELQEQDMRTCENGHFERRGGGDVDGFNNFSLIFSKKKFYTRVIPDIFSAYICILKFNIHISRKYIWDDSGFEIF